MSRHASLMYGYMNLVYGKSLNLQFNPNKHLFLENFLPPGIPYNRVQAAVKNSRTTNCCKKSHHNTFDIFFPSIQWAQFLENPLDHSMTVVTSRVIGIGTSRWGGGCSGGEGHPFGKFLNTWRSLDASLHHIWANFKKVDGFFVLE